MSAIPDLFADLDPQTPTPGMLIEAQANNLTRRTGGILEGQVRRYHDGEQGKQTYYLLAFAPVLEQRLELLRIEFADRHPYPVAVIPAPFDAPALTRRLGLAERKVSEDERRRYESALEEHQQQPAVGAVQRASALVNAAFEPIGRLSPPRPPQRVERVGRSCSTYGEVVEELARVLGSDQIRSRLNNLIALSNERVEGRAASDERNP